MKIRAKMRILNHVRQNKTGFIDGDSQKCLKVINEIVQSDRALSMRRSDNKYWTCPNFVFVFNIWIYLNITL